ncbi:MAG TPA: hypothetical protein VLY24_18045 [Bryobacteraceae bacterium]|nr:hypothetical protein [Bryobacteraceae bacterium]
MKALSLMAISALLCACGLAAEMPKKDVDLKAQDGTILKASYFSPGRPGPAILLLHQCNMDRHAWDGLAQDLASAGFHVLIFVGSGKAAVTMQTALPSGRSGMATWTLRTHT